jgi:hypothetical protein
MTSSGAVDGQENKLRINKRDLSLKKAALITRGGAAILPATTPIGERLKNGTG